MSSLRGSGCASVRHGQERNQLDEVDGELPGLDWRGVYAAAVRAAGALCVESFLARPVPTNVGCAQLDSRGRLSPHILLDRGKKSGPIAGATFQEVKFWKGFKIGNASSRSNKWRGTSGNGD